jgi:hypothetical protein
MNSEQILSILRQMMLFGGGWFVSKGWFDTAGLNELVGSLSALIAAVWAIYTRRNTGLIASAADVPSVQRIETTSPTAQALPSAKVVAP